MFRRYQLVLQLSNLSTYRTQLMGIATLMIIICHASASRVLMPRFLATIFNFGNFGVDIFLFLSGLGLYYSLSKISLSRKDDFVSFYKKRLYRIFIPYLIIYVPYCLFLIILNKYSIGDSLLCLSALEFWLFHRGAWFVSIILILYLVAPFLCRMLSGKYKWFTALGIILALMILCNIPIRDNSSTSVLHNVQWAFNRVPSFIIGLAIGSSCKENKRIKTFHAVLFFIISIAISLYVGVWKCIWLIVPILLYLFILIIKMSENTWIDKSLKLLGTISLESYLTNITLNSILCTLIPAYFTASIFYGRYLEYTIVIVIGLLLAFYVHNIAQLIISKIS